MGVVTGDGTELGGIERGFDEFEEGGFDREIGRMRAEADAVQGCTQGWQAVDYAEKDSSIPQDGFIALQVHSGPRIEVHFKDVTIEELP